MEIYIEYVLIDNMVINTLILLLVKKTLKLRTSWLRILLSSGLGTLVAVLLPLFSLPSWILFIIKIVLGVCMVLLLSRYFKLKEFIFSFLLFIGYTLFLVGASLATLLAMGTSLELLSQGGYDTVVPIGVVLLIVSVYVYIITMLAKYLTRKKEVEPFIKNVRLIVSGKELPLKAFLDSGNKLYDKKTGLPVVILSMKSMEKFYTKEILEKLILENGRDSEFKNVHTISYNTISGEAKKMIVFEADKIIINSGTNEYITNRFMVGVSYKVFNDVVNYDILLGNNLI